MAKHLVHYFTFTPSTNSVKVKGNISTKRLLLITNVTENETIYTFSDAFLGLESRSYDVSTDETTFVLTYNCNLMSSSDDLQIFYEQDYVNIEPSETYVDAVSKFRVSNPENLIDTDFEYGPQSSKWETLQTINNIPSFYASTADTTIPYILSVESVSGSEIITVTTQYDHNLQVGVPITVTGLSSLTAEGAYLIQSIASTTTFSYKARSAQPATSQLQGTYTSIIPGKFFQGSQINLSPTKGITADFYNRVVTVQNVHVITASTTFAADVLVGSEVSNGTSSATIVEVSSNTITISDLVGAIFTDGDTLTIVSASDTYTVASSGVSADSNKYFIDGSLAPVLDTSRKAVYVFDVSDSSNSGHPFTFSTTADGTHGGGSAYDTYVYRSGTEGNAGAYVRIYITNTQPSASTLYYYCASHAGMGGAGNLNVVFATQSKVLLTTSAEHGFADNTNFYFVNTVSPKVLDVVDPTANSPDGQPFVDTLQQSTQAPQTDPTQTVPYNYETTYTLRFDESDIDYGSDTITINNHGLHNRAAMLYYPNPGNRPIGGTERMQVYYVEVVDSNRIKLNQSQRLNYNVNLSAGGTFTYGNHNLGLVYNIYREYKSYGDRYAYWYTYGWNFGGTYSGYDIRNQNSTFGLGGQAWDLTAAFSTNRSGYGSSQYFYYCYPWMFAFGTRWRTYGHNLQSLPLGTTAQWQGTYDFLTDHENRGVNGTNNGNYNYGYTVGGYQGANPKSYWTGTFYATTWNGTGYLNMYGTEYYYWYIQGYYYSSIDHYFNGIGSDGNTNVYIALLKRNTSTNDSFYSESHNLDTNDAVTLTSSGSIHYYYDSTGNRTTTSSGTWYIDKIDANRFRIKTSTGASPLRLAGATGTQTFSITKTNPLRNSIYIADNQFSSGEVLKYETVGTEIGGLSNGTSYYLTQINGNRFTLAASSGGSTITLSTTGSGIQSFENTTAAFGVVDGSYTTTTAVSETELEVTVPFKVPPSTKGFDSATNVSSTYITLPNHYFGTGTRVIYDADGGSAIGGLTDGADYWVSIIDDDHFKICASESDAQADNGISLTAGTGIHKFYSSNLSGEVSGPGTLAITNGERTVVGTSAAFQRFFKIGDTIKVVNPTTTPGVLVEKRITAITDDDNLLVDSAFDFTEGSAAYLIPSYIYVRPDGFYLHRPFDGGMEIGTAKSPNSRISRQTRKYFRYQSGKGIQTSYAINFIPLIPILDLVYETAGTVFTLNATGTQGGATLTVSDTSNVLVNAPITGTGIADGTRIKTVVNATTLKIDKLLTGPLSSDAVTFHEIQKGAVTTPKPHNLSANIAVKIIDSDQEQFNHTSYVCDIIDEFNFRYLLDHVPANSSSGGFPKVQILSWSECDVRAGMFDEQNGFFYEFDGNTLNCVRRSSVLQLPGTITVNNGSNIVVGNNTKFTSELNRMDHIVIRGMSYRVVKVTSNSQLTIQPSYRGIDASNVICTKTVNTRVGQNNWNIDKADGDGPSGYTLDISKIQMCYMDYSWYGAGKIRFGFKDQNGHVKYVHEFKHNNRLTESYFRSGNLPARYEIENGDAPTYTGTLFHWGTSVIMDGMYQDDEAYLFTASGNVQKYTNATSVSVTSNNNSIITEEYVNWYTRRYFIRIPFASGNAGDLSSNSVIYNTSTANGYFSDGRRIQPQSRTSGSTHYVYIAYEEGTNTLFPRNYYSQIYSTLGNPSVSNSTTFGVGAPVGSDNVIPTDIPLISIRLAPSVDSSITGALGEREIINRMQLALDSVGILTTHETEISLILNAQLSTDAYQNVQEPSLCQLIKHGSEEVVAGGSVILSFRASGAGNGQTGATEYDLSEISDLGNSILGGDGVFPNGPDILTIIANIVDSSDVSVNDPYSVSSRVTWKESQA
tara:strand:- start:6296 stop:11923 length:5628 start_codon:yes stop_codon:yes gene_type:complete